MLGKDGMHLLNRKRVNFVSNTEMSAPVALHDSQQAGHLSDYGLVGHRMDVSFLRTLLALH
jgi:hypothetical protein